MLAFSERRRPGLTALYRELKVMKPSLSDNDALAKAKAQWERNKPVAR